MLGLGTLGVSVVVGALSLAAAPDPFEKCLAPLEQTPLAYDAVFCFYRTSEQTGLWKEGEERLRTLAPRFPGNGWVDLVFGHFARRREDIEGALSFYRRAADGFSAQSHAEGEVTARTNLRNLLWLYGRADEAGRELDRLVTIAESSKDPLLIAQAYQLRAHHLLESGGDVGTAYRLLKEADGLLPADGPYRIRRGIVLGLGNASYEMGRLDEALVWYRELDRISGEASNLYTRATAQYNIANTRLSQLEGEPGPGGLEEVAGLAQTALDSAVASDNPHMEVFALRTLGEVLGSLPGREREARADLEKCLEVAKSIGRSTELGHCLWTLSRKLAESDPGKARALAEQAVQVALSGEDSESLIRAFRQRMRLAWKTGPRGAAIEISRQTLSAIEALRALQQEDEARARLLSVWADDYYLFSGYLLDPEAGEPDLDSALSVVERLRGRVLLESLLPARSRASDARLLSNGPAVDRWHEILKTIVTTQKKLLDTRTSVDDRNRLLSELERLELDEENARLATAPAIAKHAGDVRFAKLAEIQKELLPSEALLSYQVALWKDLYGEFGGGSWALLVTRKTARALRIPDRAALRPAVDIFDGMMERRDGADGPASLGLYRDLLEEAVASLPDSVDRLIVVPDGPLHRLAFDALRPSKDGAPLGTRFEIQTVPSATLWLRWREEDYHPSATAPALALADPALEAQSGATAETRNFVLDRGLELGRLPHARVEGRRLVRELGPGSELRLGADASEDFLKHADLRPYGVLHFAAHAIADDAFPERSAVILRAGSPEEDGLLQPREIAELDLSGKIVFLSACRTASGSVLNGEGVLSLARAFFRAGARAVVGSRWPLRDDEAEVLVDGFYRELASGASVAGALLESKRTGVRSGMPAMGWASLELMGDGSVVPFPGGLPGSRRPSGWLWVAAAALALGLGVGAVVLRTRLAPAQRM
jgi:tetratricopeptide (TPR) repeat protein